MSKVVGKVSLNSELYTETFALRVNSFDYVYVSLVRVHGKVVTVYTDTFSEMFHVLARAEVSVLRGGIKRVTITEEL